MRHFRPISCPACRACQTQCNWLRDRHAGHAKTQCNWLHDRHARHAKPNANGFTFGMPRSQTQCNWLHDRHARHAKPNATSFTIDMPGMPNPMQLASRSACPACQTQCNWLHDRHARHAKPEEQIGVLPVTIPETTAGQFSGPVPFSLLKWRMVKYICPKFRFATQTLDAG